jgi:hypothetical protein
MNDKERLTRVQAEIHELKLWLENTIEFEENLDNSEYMKGYIQGLKTTLNKLKESEL